ncbi:hypothetical protein POM88_016583 [Heracleum sosnowskyi]|uniref:Uncharacterized protein n=1 Tax=Heracleum sosnowskyi TaxID=360622 RepID=A0AAD8IQW3_9APIA|nr:hypothetical protein POM88_016583 [Heracleum sosnowskyi]
MSKVSLLKTIWEDASDVDDHYVYVEPSNFAKKKRVNEPFNPCTARKGIRWKCGLIFGSKEEFKSVVREFFIATGRPLKNCVDDQQRIQLIYMEKKIRRNPNWKLAEMKDEFMRVLNVEVCDALSRVRKRAFSGVQEEMKKHFA